MEVVKHKSKRLAYLELVDKSVSRFLKHIRVGRTTVEQVGSMRQDQVGWVSMLLRRKKHR